MLLCDIFIHQGATLSFGLSIALRNYSNSVSVVIPKFFLEAEPPMLCVYPVHFPHPGSLTCSQELCMASTSSPALLPCLGTAAPEVPSLAHGAHWLPLAVTGLSAPVPRGRKGKKTKNQMLLPEIKNADWLATCNPEVVLHDDSYKKHLKQHCNK